MHPNRQFQASANQFAAQQDALYDNAQGAMRGKTSLIQLYTDHPWKGPRIISEKCNQGVPVMCMVNNQSSCVWKLDIPNGMYCLEQKWGVDSGIMEPGGYWCYCNYKRPVCMVSKDTIRYRCPITHIPTKDNVRVSMDIGINFHIGRPELMNHEDNDKDLKKFFYNFGPNRLEELMSESVDEEIRTFCKHIKVAKIRDIKTELTASMKQQLTERFAPYGVYIESFTIMNVILPRDLREYLMFTTNYDVYLQKQVKQQCNKMLILNNNENKKILQLKRDNIQKLMTCQHDIDVEEIQLIQTKIEGETEQLIKSVNAYKKQNVKKIEADNIKALAARRAEEKAVQTKNEAKAYYDSQKIFADTQAQIITANAQARFQIAKSKSAALITEAEAELEQASKLENERRFKEKMLLASSMKDTARSSKIVVAGGNGEQVLGFYNETLEQVSKR